jgi:branched-chain amino acid aminotransferase
MIAYVNGEYLPLEDAKVSVTDHSFLYGDGCFEGIGIHHGRILHLDEHVERLFLSARMLRIDMPNSLSEVRAIILETARRNRMDAEPMGYLRPLVSRGAGPLGLKWSNKLGPATFVVIPQLGDRRVGYSGEIDTVTATITSQVRAAANSVDPRIKANNYLSSIMCFLEAQDKGADIGLLRDDRGFISEGHAMNIFCVRDDRVVTPKESAALGGITRANVLATARQLGVDVVETDITMYDVVCADEVFVTSSLDGVAAVSAIDGREIAGTPGPITRQVRDAYVEHAVETATLVPSSADIPDDESMAR